MNIDPIASAYAKLEVKGVHPDRLEITGRDAAKLGIGAAGRLLGMSVCTGQQSRLGGYMHPIGKYELSGRVWEMIDL